MASTALSLVQKACHQANIPAPTALVGETNTTNLQLLALFYEAGEELRSCRYWPQLKRSYTVYLEAGRSKYYLPQDFYCALPMTHWDKSNNWEMRGPQTDPAWNYRQYGYVTTENRRSYRIFGQDINYASGRGQFEVHPVPGAGEAGDRVSFEYISRSWLIPPLWSASATLAQNTWRFSAGNIYKKTDANSELGSTVPPNMAYGEGQDGGAFWKHITHAAWQAATVYAAGAYVTNGGNLYRCTDGGTSAGSGGPTGTDTTTAVTDNTVSWLYIDDQAWAAQTSFATGAVVLVSTVYYLCTVGGITGSTGPTWTATTVPDGAITWEFQQAPYEALVTDSDLCLFDDEMMTKNLKWRFMAARGLTYGEVKAEYEQMKESAFGRWNTGQVLSLAGSGSMAGHGINIPEGDFG